MDETKVIAAILSTPIIHQLGGGGVDVPPEVAVSVYEEVLRTLHEKDIKDAAK